MVEQIHECAVRISTSLPFPILIHCLYSAVGVHIEPHRDPQVEALCTTDPSLIKAEENPMTLQRATFSPILKPFLIEPQTQEHTPTTTSAAPATSGLSPTIEIKAIPSSSTPAPAPSTIKADFFYLLLLFRHWCKG